MKKAEENEREGKLKKWRWKRIMDNHVDEEDTEKEEEKREMNEEVRKRRKTEKRTPMKERLGEG